MGLILENPSWLYLWVGLTSILILLHFYTKRSKAKEAIKFANVPLLQKLVVKGYRTWKGEEFLSLGLKSSILLLVCLMAGGLATVTPVPTKELYLVLSLDNSYTMLFEDYRPNRLEAAKKALSSFLDRIDYTTARVGVVAFGPTVEVIQNFSTNPSELKRAIDNIKVATLAGTAIGDALIVSSQLIPEGEVGIIILLTDGRNNLGILLENAIESVKRREHVVHVVGVGSSQPQFAEINKEELNWIASETGGVASFSESDVELQEIYERISGLILRPKVVVEKIYLTPYLLIITATLLVADFLLSRFFSTLP